MICCYKSFQIKLITVLRQHLQKYTSSNQNLIKLISYKNIVFELKKLNQNKYTSLSHAIIFRFILFDSITNSNDVFARYWTNKSIDELIEEADNLFEAGHYLQVYEILNRLRHYGNIEIHWRVCRTLFKLSSCENVPNNIRERMIIEAYNLIKETMKLDENHPEV